jgi:dihydrofolate reductase
MSGRLPWHVPSELQLFKQKTEGHALIMGRRTFESLTHLLPNRHHIIISKTMSFTNGISIVPTLDEALNVAQTLDVEKVFLIGGVSIFEEAIHTCRVIHLSRIMLSPAADIYYQFVPIHHRIVASHCFQDPSTKTDIIYQCYEKFI